ncbi:hypothetical protein BP5796_09438 [Coleophoma crateriformis]|uniref:Acyltransferase 3 domain-containing protein n=1 Tax=Coleophoma crateriformis TaxID=565419 RepID=A0A3D8QY29_9HELO|nr:hypothetical protein BP5796_09438 [Coleophoma crateriformis]
MDFRKMMQKPDSFVASPPTTYEQEYLLGFRGLLVIQSFLWVFLTVFVPVTVAQSKNTTGPLYEEVFRKVLSVLFWNEYFLYGAIIFLSARSIAIPFIKKPSREQAAKSIFCRGLSLWFPLAIALAIVKLSFTKATSERLYDFKTRTGNNSIAVPYIMPTTLAYFNSVFNLFWTTKNFMITSGNTAFPSQTLWLINAVYIQSYTVYMTMIIIPYTRKEWRVKGAIVFVILAWWCDSWAWYTISGLLFADMVMTMDFKACAQRGIPINTPCAALKKADGSAFRLPVWIPAGLCITAGLLMQYLWVAWRPSLFSHEYLAHTGMYYTDGLNTQYTTHHIPARDDIYLILVGFFTLLETYDFLQRFFQNKFFVYLGRRSLSYFLVQSIIIYLVGTLVFRKVRRDDNSTSSAAAIASLISCLAITVPAAEIFHRLIELPSKVFAHKLYDFVTA